jgi:LysM repeat protein
MTTGGAGYPGTGEGVTQEEYSAVCPYLGLADDADSHATYATEAHRCYRLPNPTRIAPPHQELHCLGANHVNCMVYRGEGVPGAGAPAPAPVPPVTAGRPPEPTQTVRGPEGRPQQQRPRFGEAQPAVSGRPPRRNTNPGTLGPRPRSGGVSMPVATVGLFALALIVIGLAFAIQQIVGDGGNNQLSPGEVVETRQAQIQTLTAQAGGGGSTETQTPGAQTPGNGQTPGTGQTPTPTTATGGGTTHTVESGEFCSTIAADYGITLQQLLNANDMTEDDCLRLQVGQILIIP